MSNFRKRLLTARVAYLQQLVDNNEATDKDRAELISTRKRLTI